jgi:hypothetical protein
MRYVKPGPNVIQLFVRVTRSIPMSAGCPVARTASPAKTKAIRGHDHAKFHKLM